jgi:hypothetical protein
MWFDAGAGASHSKIASSRARNALGEDLAMRRRVAGLAGFSTGATSSTGTHA